MPISRREFISAAAAAGAACCLTRCSKGAFMADEKFFEWKPVTTGATAGFGLGGNSLVVVGKSGALLVDTKFAYCGQQLRREADSIAKLTHVVNTHHHGDHTGGNLGFTKDLPVYAQTKATPRILDQKARYISQIKEAGTAMKDKTGPAADQVRTDGMALLHRASDLSITEFAPKTTFEKDFELDLGGCKAQLHHFGPGHTDNDIIVHVPSLNLIHTGDLLFNKTHPVIDRDGGATTSGWMESLRKVIAICDDKTRLVPGHGELCGVEGLKEQMNYFEKMRAIVANAIKEGKPRKDIVEMHPTLFEGYAGGQRVGMALAAIYEELKTTR